MSGNPSPIDLQEVVVQLANHETRLRVLEDQKGIGVSNQKRAPAAGSSSKRRKGSTKPIMELIRSGLFNEAKSIADIQTALKRRAFLFDQNDTATTSMRLVQRNILKREGSGTKSDPWKYRAA